MTEEACKNAIIRLVEPLAHALGLVLWGVEIVRTGRILVRVYVDVPAAAAVPGQDLDFAETATEDAALDAVQGASAAALSASLDQCEKISRQLALALDVEDCFADPYVLEVSTPGLTRLFFHLEQMPPYLGHVVEARLEQPLAPDIASATDERARRVWRGTLLSVEGDAFMLSPVRVSPEGEVLPENLPPVRIPWEAARRVSRMYVFRQPVKPGKGSGKGSGKKTAKGTGKKAGKGVGADAGSTPETAPEKPADATAGRIPG